jgi:hypothetical protein
VLVFESTEQLLAESEARRYLHSILLTAVRDKAERLEIRFGEADGMLYYRVSGRDWELTPPPDEIYPLLKEEVRSVSRLVPPERPPITLTAGIEGARFEPLEVGWLTYQLGAYWLDLVVRIDPREPYGSIQFDLEHPEEFAELAGEVLDEYHASLADAPEQSIDAETADES